MSSNETPSPSGLNEQLKPGALGTLGGFGLLLVAIIACTVFLSYAAERGEASLPEAGGVLRLSGQPGRELRIRLSESDSLGPETSRLTGYLVDPPGDMESSLEVRVRSGLFGVGVVALLTVPQVPGEEDVALKGFLSGVIDLDEGVKQLEVPFELRIAPTSVIGPPIEPLLSPGLAGLLVLVTWCVAVTVFMYLAPVLSRGGSALDTQERTPQ